MHIVPMAAWKKKGGNALTTKNKRAAQREKGGKTPLRCAVGSHPLPARLPALATIAPVYAARTGGILLGAPLGLRVVYVAGSQGAGDHSLSFT